MNSKTISVIIPVYNAEKYIDRCIHSILYQTFTDFELILINDGSKDSSGTICEQYALKDSRIRLFNRTNHGVSATRQFGIEHCRGKYCIQIDSDDWIDIDFFEKLIRKAKGTNADIVYCGFIKEFVDKSYKVKMFTTDSSSDYLSAILTFRAWGSVWNKLINMDLINNNNICFTEGVCMWEDLNFIAKCLLFTKKIAFCDSTYYHYTQYNNFSLCSTVSTYDMPSHTIAAIADLEKYIIAAQKSTSFSFELAIAKLFAKQKLLFDSRFRNIIKWINVFQESNHYFFHFIIYAIWYRLFPMY